MISPLKISFEGLEAHLPSKDHDSLYRIFNHIRHQHTNYDELLKQKPTPKERREVIAEISALIVMKFPELKEVALHHCRRKGCLKEFKKYNTFETVVELPKPKDPTKATLIKMITKVLHKDKHFVGLLDWIVNGKRMAKSLGFETLLKTKFKNIYLLLEKFKKGELK